MRLQRWTGACRTHLVKPFAPVTPCAVLSAVLCAALCSALVLHAALASATPAGASPQLVFEDGFEGADRFLDLFERNGRRWTHFQRTLKGNRVEVRSKGARVGRKFLRLYAAPSRRTVSKADIERALDVVGEGDTLVIEAWMRLPRRASLNDVFLLDLECESCWPRFSLLPNKSPGIRVQLKGDAGRPVVERGKIGRKSYRHTGRAPARAVPRGRWTRMRFQARLASDRRGSVSVSFDGRIAFESAGPNLPDPRLFARWGVRLRHTGYDRFQIGITANGSRNPVEMLLDGVAVRVERGRR